MVPNINSIASLHLATHGENDFSFCSSQQFNSVLHNDHDFLLRSAMTHDWDTVVSFCQFLQEIFGCASPSTSILTSSTSTTHLDQCRHKHHRNRIWAAQHQLIHKDQWGNTALHAACYNSPPVRVVQAILQAAAASGNTSNSHDQTHRPLQVHTVLSRDHSTPLLVACATGASLEVVQALLSPPAPLGRGGAMVGVADQQGATPLSELAVHYDLQRQSPMQQQHHPMGLLLPLDQLQLCVSDTSPDNPQQHDDNINQTNDLLQTFQAKLEALLEAAWKDTFPSQPQIPSMIHGLANVATSCPPVVTRLVLRSYPFTRSASGHSSVCPLHLTVSQVPTRGVAHHASFVTRHAYCVSQLVAADPAAARRVLRKTDKLHDTRTEYSMESERRSHRTPLLQAIASGWFWHATTTVSTNHKTNDNRGPVQAIWQQAPEGITQVDPVTGLPPILLAATSTWSITLRQRASSQTLAPQEAQEQILQLDTLFHLLRLNPQVLEECITVTPRA